MTERRGDSPDSSETSELLVLAIDLTPVWWGTYAPEGFLLPNFIEAVLAFVNVHLMLSPLNETAILGVTPERTEFLWPSKMLKKADDRATYDGQYEALAILGETVRQKAYDLVSSCESLNCTVAFSGAIIKALCYFMRRCRELRPTVALPTNMSADAAPNFEDELSGLLRGSLRARILVIRAAEDAASQYLPLMNSVFTAQKLRVPIDACIIPPTTVSSTPEDLRHTSVLHDFSYSSLFQQAADLTGGIYLRVPRPAGLLQYLISVFLPRVSMRSVLILPDSRNSGPSLGVDFRAACFCHRQLVDLAYVCSVCLSVFCSFSPVCSTCNSPFKVPKPGNK
uniref:General transcription factor IIH subunit 3 n=1 Tax=Schistocephalus solidus TaxID=70667 RepID=A0A0V0JAN1_SCHSO